MDPPRKCCASYRCITFETLEGCQCVDLHDRIFQRHTYGTKSVATSLWVPALVVNIEALKENSPPPQLPLGPKSNVISFTN